MKKGLLVKKKETVKNKSQISNKKKQMTIKQITNKCEIRNSKIICHFHENGNPEENKYQSK